MSNVSGPRARVGGLVATVLLFAAISGGTSFRAASTVLAPAAPVTVQQVTDGSLCGRHVMQLAGSSDVHVGPYIEAACVDRGPVLAAA